MEIEILQRGRICGVDPNATDSTAMDYVRSRSNVAEPIEPFGTLLFSIGPKKSRLPNDDYNGKEVFFNAVN